MEVTASERVGIVVLEPIGAIDTRGAFDFERAVLGRLDGGARRFVVDLARVELVTSAGIRVLVMLAKRLQGLEGALALCRLNDQVRTVLEIAGLASQFQIADSVDAAAALVAPPAEAAGPPRGSRVSRLASHLLGEGAGASAAAAGSSSRPSALSTLVAQLLGESAREAWPGGPRRA